MNLRMDRAGPEGLEPRLIGRDVPPNARRPPRSSPRWPSWTTRTRTPRLRTRLRAPDVPEAHVSRPPRENEGQIEAENRYLIRLIVHELYGLNVRLNPFDEYAYGVIPRHPTPP
jgi:hypothetical protein